MEHLWRYFYAFKNVASDIATGKNIKITIDKKVWLVQNKIYNIYNPIKLYA